MTEKMRISDKWPVIPIIMVAGGVLLWRVDSPSGRAFITSHLSHPGIRILVLQFVAWHLLLLPPMFGALLIAKASQNEEVHAVGVVWTWGLVILTLCSTGLFTWFIVSWGYHTGWTFTK